MKKVPKKRTKKTEVVVAGEQPVAPKKTKKVKEVVETPKESQEAGPEASQEEASQEVSQEAKEPVAAVVAEPPKEKVVRKKTVVKKSEGDGDSTSSKASSSKATSSKDKKEEKIKLSEIKPKSVPQFFAILASYIRQNTHYVGLRENTEGLIVPVFSVITGPYDKETKKFPCQFFKETVTTDQDGDVTVKPIWEELWQTGFITQSQCLNMLPFDETQQYFYTPKTVEEQKASLYNM